MNCLCGNDLPGRCGKGRHTPTDEAYKANQLLETELLAILDDLLQGLAQQEENQ